MSTKSTPDEILRQKIESIPDKDLIERCDQLVSDLCNTGGRAFRMSVPVSRYDSDMILSELIRRYKNKTNHA